MRTIETLLIVVILFFANGCSKSEKVVITNTVEVNSQKVDMKDYKQLEGNIANFQQITVAESTRFIKEGGSGIIYYGYVGCPFCERAIPLLNQAAIETGITIYYVDVKAKPMATDAEYQELVALIESTFDLDQNGEPAFYVPEVMGIKKGKITGYQVALVDGWKPADANDQMDDQQKEKQLGIYKEIIRKTSD